MRQESFYSLSSRGSRKPHELTMKHKKGSLRGGVRRPLAHRPVARRRTRAGIRYRAGAGVEAGFGSTAGWRGAAFCCWWPPPPPLLLLLLLLENVRTSLDCEIWTLVLLLALLLTLLWTPPPPLLLGAARAGAYCSLEGTVSYPSTVTSCYRTWGRGGRRCAGLLVALRTDVVAARARVALDVDLQRRRLEESERLVR